MVTHDFVFSLRFKISACIVWCDFQHYQNNKQNCGCLHTRLPMWLLKYITEFEHKIYQNMATWIVYYTFHFAAINGHMTVRYLTGELGCNIILKLVTIMAALQCTVLVTLKSLITDLCIQLLSIANWFHLTSAVILKLVTIMAALHYTVLVSHVEVTKYLTNTVQNMAILHLCIQLLSIATWLHVVKYHGCNPQISNNYGSIPLHHAHQNGCLEVTVSHYWTPIKELSNICYHTIWNGELVLSNSLLQKLNLPKETTACEQLKNVTQTHIVLQYIVLKFFTWTVKIEV